MSLWPGEISPLQAVLPRPRPCPVFSGRSGASVHCTPQAAYCSYTLSACASPSRLNSWGRDWPSHLYFSGTRPSFRRSHKCSLSEGTPGCTRRVAARWYPAPLRLRQGRRHLSHSQVAASEASSLPGHGCESLAALPWSEPGVSFLLSCRGDNRGSWHCFYNAMSPS